MANDSVFSTEFFFFSLSCLCVFSLTVIMSLCPSSPYASVVPILEIMLACTERGRTLINYFGGSVQTVLTPIWMILRCTSWLFYGRSSTENPADPQETSRRGLRREATRCFFCNQSGHYTRDCAFRQSDIGPIDAVTVGLILLCLYLHYIGYEP